MSDPYQLIKPAGPITCFAFNKDKTKMAISPNSNEVVVYKKSGKDWVIEATLSEHDKLVTGIDWAPESDRIVSCSQDRNAYVWTFTDGVWAPTLVILRINRAATQVKWSPSGTKFAVASGQRCISVCYFDPDQDWWVSKHIRKPIRSTVLSIDWHPNNVLIACGSSDFKARVFSGYIKDLEKKPEATAWGARMPFGEMLGEFRSNGWVHDVKFSPCGDKIAFVSHDSTFSVAKGGEEAQTVKTNGVPFRVAMWVSPKSVVAAGHSCAPVLFSDNGGKWAENKCLDVPEKKAAAGKSSAMDTFRGLDSRAQSEGSSQDTTLATVHQNSIGNMLPFSGTRDSVKSFITAGVDGMLVTWDCAKLASSVGVTF